MGGNGETMERLAPFLQRSSPRVLIFKEIGNGDRVLGFSMFHWARLSMLYNEFNNNMVSEYIRDNAVGRIVVLDGIFTDKENSHENLEQIILTETLCYCLAKDYNYAVYRNIMENYPDDTAEEVLELQGFQRLYFGNSRRPIFIVDMSSPCTLNLDISNVIKDPSGTPKA